MAKRFSQYKFALKANGGVAAAGSALEKYKNYKSGATVVTYPSDPTSNPGQMKQIFLSPFATAPDTRYFSEIGTRAQTKLTDLGLSASTCNHLTSATGAIYNRGFSPAKAVVQTGGSSTNTEISKITGVTYKKAVGAASYTVPFGAQLSAGENRFFINMINVIKAAVEAKNSLFSVSFQPEIFRL